MTVTGEHKEDCPVRKGGVQIRVGWDFNQVRKPPLKPHIMFCGKCGVILEDNRNEA